MQTDSIILDVDGTLWDSTPIVAKAWTRAVQEGGCPDKIVTADMLRKLFGRTMKVIADLLLPEVEEKKRYEIMDVCCVYEHQALEEDECRICYPGVIDTIRSLSERFPVCIVSNCQSGYIELFLEKTGLGPYVKDFECYGNTGKNKADNIRLLVGRNGFSQPVYVGDTQGDLDASREAGVPFLFASYGFGQPGEYDGKLDSFADLQTLLER
jgi:phosphoglycolate phosphatase